MRWLVILASLALAPLGWAGCVGGCPGQHAPAVETAWSGDAHAPSRLIVERPTHDRGGALWGAIEIDIAEGWFVYAPRASDAVGVELEMTGSVNLAPLGRRWPAPEMTTLDGAPVAIYRGRVVLPLRISPLQPDEDIRVSIGVRYAVCGEVCRPAYAVHKIRIASQPVASPPSAERHAATIAGALGASR